MTQTVSRPDAGAPGGPPGVLAALLALGVLAAVLALLAGLFGWYTHEMLLASGGIGLAVAALLSFLVFRQRLERREAALALHNVEARVSGIVDSAMDAIIAVDERQRIVLFNAAAERVFRWPQGAVLGQPLGMLIPERLREAHGGHIARFGATGVTSRRMGAQTVLVGLRSTGEEFPIEASISQHVEQGKKTFTVILRDITERVKGQQELARGEARLRGILDSAMDAIITIDDKEHVVLFNRAAEQVFGCPRDQAIGAPLSWFIPERFRAGHHDHIRRFGETGTSSRRMGALRIVTGLRRNGEEFPIDASISQISESGARFYTVILRDVTERVRGEEALKRSREELRELAQAANSVREQEKSRIARELHDELAQALTALKMDVNWIAERAGGGNDVLEEKLAAMQSMLDDTVAATRRISADLRPLMLDDLGLVPAVEWLAQGFTERSGVACELKVDEAQLDLGEPHASAVFRILQESLTNVAKHAQASRVEMALVREDGAVTLSVSDNGRGFSPQDPRKPSSFGLMGLRERAYALGGEVRIDSAPGRGTRIDVRIPLHERGER
ncbi:MAG TPA: PAS domain-containing sensor histidine kinase [Burkholderiales bacterium]|nr:PAS domain-containing sensor histidine kinase [Burkholderiales bacterium]